MQKKWGYPTAILAAIASVTAVVSVVLSLHLIAIAATVVTLVSSCATAIAAHQSASMIQKKTARLSDPSFSKAAVRHHESISHAVETHEIEDIDEKANTESATRAPAGLVDDLHRDEESGLLSNSFFPVYLEQRITAARRTLRPVSLVIFELDGLDKNDSGSPSDRNFYISAVGDVVKRTLRESDCAFRIEANVFAAVMDDTTESGAVWAAERVRGVLHTGALAGRVTVSAGVACYPSHALEPQDLIESATKALDAAKSRGVDQVEIAAEQ